MSVTNAEILEYINSLSEADRIKVLHKAMADLSAEADLDQLEDITSWLSNSKAIEALEDREADEKSEAEEEARESD